MDTLFAPLYSAVEHIGSFIQSAFSLLVDSVNNLLTAFSFIVSSVPFITSVAGLMPGIICTSVIIILAFSVIKFIIGR